MSSAAQRVLKGRLIIVEGNISAGKTTLCATLSEALGGKVFLEPTLSNPYLTDFYADPQRWGLKMQLWLLRQRYRTYIDSVVHTLESGSSVILDRSVWSDWVFAENSRVDGLISPEGFEYYLAIRGQMLARLPAPHIAVFLDVDPSECHRRIHDVRKRDCESGIPVEYLQGLHKCYHLFVDELRSKGSKVLHYRWDQFGSVDDVVNDIYGAESRGELFALDEETLRNFLSDREAINEAMMPTSFEMIGLAKQFEDTDRVFDFLAQSSASDIENSLLLKATKRARSQSPSISSCKETDIVIESQGMSKRVGFSMTKTEQAK